MLLCGPDNAADEEDDFGGEGPEEEIGKSAALALLARGLSSLYEKGTRSRVNASEVQESMIEIMPSFSLRKTPFKKFQDLLNQAAMRSWIRICRVKGGPVLVDIISHTLKLNFGKLDTSPEVGTPQVVALMAQGINSLFSEGILGPMFAERVHDAMIKLDPSFRVRKTSFKKPDSLVEKAVEKGWVTRVRNKLGKMQVKITGPIIEHEKKGPANKGPAAGEIKHEQVSLTGRTATGEEKRAATAVPALKGTMRQVTIAGPTVEDGGTEAQVTIAGPAHVDVEDGQVWAPEDMSFLARNINEVHASLLARRAPFTPVFASALFPESAFGQGTRVDKRRRMVALLEQAEKNQWVKLDRTTGHLKVIIHGPVVFNKSQQYQGAPSENGPWEERIKAAMPPPLPPRKGIPGAPGIDFTSPRSSSRGAAKGAERRLPPPPKVAPPQRT